MGLGRVKGDKYRPKFCKQLLNGLRYEGMSIVEVCHSWGITVKTYYRWIEVHPEFKEAAEYGDRDQQCYWQRLTRSAAEGKVKANAGVICFAMKNIQGIQWQDKIEVNNTSDEQIKQINISILPAPLKAITHDINIIEHDSDGA